VRYSSLGLDFDVHQQFFLFHCIVDSINAATEEFLWSTVDPFKTVISVKKGMNNLTEMYSAIEAEVPLPEDPRTYTNQQLIAHLKRAKKVVVCGQVLSHCVNYTTRDVLKNWTGRNPADIILLTDCNENL
jgi:nicotinamidase/pyrazinamidase